MSRPVRTRPMPFRPVATLAGFTLVELVVVVALMSLLLAMLLPAVTLARSKSRGAKCINNLRQIAIAMEHYRDENDDHIPNPLIDPATIAASQARNGNDWSFLPMAYAETTSAPGSFAEYCGDTRVLRCPDAQQGIDVSYGLNGQVVSVIDNFRHVTNPSETPLVFDCNKSTGYYYSDLAPRHVGCANILYADSHIGLRFYDTLYHFPYAVPLPGLGSLFDIEVRITGTPWDAVDIQLADYRNRTLGTATMYRDTGNPAEQTIHLGTFNLDPTSKAQELEPERWDGAKTYSMSFRLYVEQGESNPGGHPKKDPGGNPLWIRINGGHWTHVATVNKGSPTKTVDVTALLASAIP